MVGKALKQRAGASEWKVEGKEKRYYWGTMVRTRGLDTEVREKEFMLT